MKKRYKRYILLTLLIIASIGAIIYGITYAKYVSNSVWNYYLKSQGFYFSSDLLSTNNTKNVNNLWDGRSVNFSINNSLNQTVISNYDINYEVTCTITGEATEHLTCNVYDTGTNKYEGVLSSSQICVNNTEDGIDVSEMLKTECEENGYEYNNQIATKDLYFDIVSIDEIYEIKDITVNIEVTSTKPYRKTLSGDFILHKIIPEEEKIQLKYKGFLEYSDLIISNSYKIPKCIKISWDSSKMIIDTNGNSFSSFSEDENGYINEIKLNIDAKKSLNYIFYKKDFTKTYDVTDFTYSDATGC